MVKMGPSKRIQCELKEEQSKCVIVDLLTHLVLCPKAKKARGAWF